MELTTVETPIPRMLQEPRSPGLHVSDIITHIAVSLGYLDGDKEFNSTWGELGFAMEDAICERYFKEDSDRFEKPGELCQDGVYLTPDLLDVYDPVLSSPVLHEIKFSWMSSKNDPHGPKFWRYWTQVKAYCYVIETRHAVLHVVHANGDYRGDHPRNLEHRAKFTQDELNENWLMLMNHREAVADKLGIEY